MEFHVLAQKEERHYVKLHDNFMKKSNRDSAKKIKGIQQTMTA